MTLDETVGGRAALVLFYRTFAALLTEYQRQPRAVLIVVHPEVYRNAVHVAAALPVLAVDLGVFFGTPGAPPLCVCPNDVTVELNEHSVEAMLFLASPPLHYRQFLGALVPGAPLYAITPMEMET